jgi:hypothetical protein
MHSFRPLYSHTPCSNAMQGLMKFGQYAKIADLNSGKRYNVVQAIAIPDDPNFALLSDCRWSFSIISNVTCKHNLSHDLRQAFIFLISIYGNVDTIYPTYARAWSYRPSSRNHWNWAQVRPNNCLCCCNAHKAILINSRGISRLELPCPSWSDCLS